MMKAVLNSVLFFFVSCIFLLCSISPTDLAGPSTEEGNPVIAGIVLDTASHPVSNAEVVVYRLVSVYDTIETVIRAATSSTDKDGKFSFYALAPGTYLIYITNPDNTMFALKQNIVIESDTSAVMENDRVGVMKADTLFLHKPGYIKGLVTRGDVLGTTSQTAKNDAFIQVMIKELGMSYTTGPDGFYEFFNIPEGVYTMIYYADDGFFTTYKDSVEALSDDTTEIETVTLERIPWLAPPKPDGLSGEYNPAEGIVRLWWHPVNLPKLRGYKVVRYDESWMEDAIYSTVDTFFVDTVISFPNGTVLSYIVRSVNTTFMESANEGPVEIVVAK